MVLFADTTNAVSITVINTRLKQFHDCACDSVKSQLLKLHRRRRESEINTNYLNDNCTREKENQEHVHSNAEIRVHGSFTSWRTSASHCFIVNEYITSWRVVEFHSSIAGSPRAPRQTAQNMITGWMRIRIIDQVNCIFLLPRKQQRKKETNSR